MTTILKALEEKYNGQAISSIESECARFKEFAFNSRMEFILALYYLERTKRFTENPVYSKSTFEDYIRAQFGMTHAAYDKERFAYISCPKAAQKWGVGVIDAIKRDCGAGKIPEVIRQIEALKDPSREDIEKVIQANESDATRERRERKASAKDMKQIAEYIETAIDKDKQIDELKTRIDELNLDRDRLIIALEEAKQQIDRISKGLLALHGENETLKKKLAERNDRMQHIPEDQIDAILKSLNCGIRA